MKLIESMEPLMSAGCTAPGSTLPISHRWCTSHVQHHSGRDTSLLDEAISTANSLIEAVTTYNLLQKITEAKEHIQRI